MKFTFTTSSIHCEANLLRGIGECFTELLRPFFSERAAFARLARYDMARTRTGLDHLP